MLKKTISLALIVLLFSLCKKKKENTPEDAPVFDKQELMRNMADGLILPRYTAFVSSLDSLISAYQSFKVSLTEADLQLTRKKLHSAYLAYQHISLYEFGPAEQQMLRMHCNTFPTDTPQIKSCISSGVYDLSASGSMDAKGFPALDYLLFDQNRSEAQLVQAFSASPARKQYVTDLLSDIKTRITAVVAGWNNTYGLQFKSSLGSDIGSSIGALVNQMNFELDYLKNFKLGIPLGKKTLGITMPEQCEAYHGGQSVEYALATLSSIENTYLGRNSANGLGFDDYLDQLNATYNGGSLNAAIQAQFNAARAKLGAIPGRLSAQIKADPAPVNAAYTELVKLLVLLKTDLPSSLGVIITYQDGDGD